MVLTRESIQQINDKRRGEAYFDREAANAVNDCMLKKELLELSLVRTFDYGGSKGFWLGNHIIQQVEDVTDCFKTTLGNGFEYCSCLIIAVDMLRNVRMVWKANR